jgi:hypothetical protein
VKKTVPLLPSLHGLSARLRDTGRAAGDVLALALFGTIWALNDRADRHHWGERRARRRLDRLARDARVTDGPRPASPS